MKKLITGVIAAAALLFGFASCSGDLHDDELPKHEPVTISGASWYYYDITVYGDNDGNSGNFILNNKGAGSQTTDTLMPAFTAKDGGVFYFTGDQKDGNHYSLLTSYQTDNPEYTPVPGTIRFYIYTNESDCTFYCFGNDNAFASMNWPGATMTKSGEVAKETYNAKATLKSIKITGLPTEANGQKLYLTGAPFSWASPGSGNSKEVTVQDGKIEINDLNLELSVENVVVGQIGSSEMKFAAANWARPEIAAADGGNFKILVTDGAEINLVGVWQETKIHKEGGNIYCCIFGQ